LVRSAYSLAQAHINIVIMEDSQCPPPPPHTPAPECEQQLEYRNPLLASVIAGFLALAFQPAASAQNTLPTVYVYAPGGGGGGWFGSGGGHGGWGGVSTVAPENPGVPDECPNIHDAALSIACDLKNPPRLVVNGCGSRGSAWVPDGVPGYPGLFSAACNEHDVCYGSMGVTKESCDANLGARMARECQSISSADVLARGLCVLAASAYPAALRGLPQAETAFAKAQQEAECRNLSAMAKTWGCT